MFENELGATVLAYYRFEPEHIAAAAKEQLVRK